MCRSFFKKPTYCVCGLYIRVNSASDMSHLAYLDLCEQTSFDIQTELKFKYYNSITHETPALYSQMNCDHQIQNEDNEAEWAKVPLDHTHFKCARLKNDFCLTYVIRTVGLGHNIKVKSDVYCDSTMTSDPFPAISVSPALKSQEVSGGMCGKWSRENPSECNYVDENGACVSLAETEKILKHWK